MPRREASPSEDLNVMLDFEIHELSAVDFPMQEPAKKLVIKRRDTDDDDEPELVSETDEEDEDDEDDDEDGETTTAAEPAEEDSMTTRKTDTAAPVAPEETKADTPAALAKRLAALEAEFEKADAYGALTDGEKAHYAKLDDAAKATFLKADAQSRRREVEAAIAKAADADPVAYTGDDGRQYRKSAGEDVIALAKRADNSDRVAKSEREKREAQELAKRAETELPHLPDPGRRALLKAAEAIADPTERTAALEALKAQDNGVQMAKAFERAGFNGATTKNGTTAMAKLEAGAQEFAKGKGLTKEQAFVEYTKTEEGNALYMAHREEMITARK